MPLLRRREFKPSKPPRDLRPDEEVFLCRLTNEIFRDYDDFFKRTILCNSLVWSCKLTGRPGLTYQEAEESEERALKFLASFPVYLEAPVLYLASLTKRGRLADMCDDIFVFVRDRFFIGEIVDVIHKDTRETCRVNKVIVPPEFRQEPDNGASECSSDDEIILIKDDGKEEKMNTSREKQKTPKRSLAPQMLKPSVYRYEVTSLQGSGTYQTTHNKISRKRGLFTKDKNKLYLKQHCQVVENIWSVKPSFVAKFHLQRRNFEEFFAGPVPNFTSTPAKRPTYRREVVVDSDDDDDDDDETEDSEDDDDIPLMEVKKKAEMQKKTKKQKTSKSKGANKENRASPAEPKPKKPKLTPEEKAAIKEQLRQERLKERMLMKQRLAEERAQERAKIKEELAKAKEQLRVQREQEKAARREQVKKDMEESKEKRRKEREEERERQRIKFEYMKEWMKPREDLECEDLKDLPQPVPVSGRIPQDLFGGCAMLLEFLHAFGDQLGVKDDFPDGVSLEMLEEALLSNRVDGPLYDIVRFLLASIFRVQEEDEEEWKTDLQEQGLEVPKVNLSDARLEEDPDPTYAAMTSAATAALAWPVVHQGTNLRKLPMDPTTVTEIVRLHFLASGARLGSEDSKWRYQQRGGYTSHDDPGLEFRMQEAGVLKTLTKGNIFDLDPAIKLKLLTTLTNQLLTYVTIRDVIEENFDSWQTSRRELRELHRQEQRREKEEQAARWRLRLEEKAQERAAEKQQRDLMEKERMEKLMGDGVVDCEMISPVTGSTIVTPESGSRPQSRAKNPVGDTTSDAMEADGPVPGMTPAEIEEKRKELTAEGAEKRSEFIKQEEELSKEIADAISKYSLTPLGEDRFFCRYWKFNALPGLFVECDRYISDEAMAKLAQDMKSAKEVNGQATLKIETQLASEHDTSNSSNKENEDSNVVKANAQLENGDVHMVPSDSQPQLSEAEDPKETSMEINGDMPELAAESSRVTVFTNSRARWAFYNSPSDVDKLLDSLNVRGYREGALKEAVQQEKSKLVNSMQHVPTDFLTKPKSEEDDVVQESQSSIRRQVEVKMTSGKKGLMSGQANVEEKLELMLREQILDIEDRMWQGALGFIKVNDRATWIEAVEQGSYDRQCKDISWGPVWARSILDDGDFLNMSRSDLPMPEDKLTTKSKDRLSELKKTEMTFTGSPSSTRCNTPDPTDNVVRDLACAVLQVSQGVEDKYLKAPLGNQEDGKPMTRNRKKQEEEEEQEKEKKPRKTCREYWEESLMGCTSFSQIFLHLSTLERSVLWNKSILKARCRMCRRGGNPEQMLLCDGCNRGHHMFCLKPPLKKVPQGDWYCKDCTPKEIKKSPHKRVMKKKQVEESSDEESEEDSEESEQESEEEEKSEEELEVSESEEEVDESEQEEVEVEDEDEEEEDEEEEDEEEEEEEEDDEDEDMENDVSDEDEGSDMDENEHEDVCWKCHHGGQLICCDTCPKVYHVECCMPVLWKVPKGQWECEACKKKAKSTAIRLPTGKKGIKKFASKSKRESPKSQSKLPEKVSPQVKSQGKTRQSRQSTPEPGNKGAKGKATSQLSKASQQERRGLKRTRGERMESTDSDSSQKEETLKEKAQSSHGSYKVILNGSISLDDSASDSSGPSYKNRRSSSGRGNRSLAQLTKCEQLLKELVKHSDAGPFLNAVSKRSVPDYYRIIKRPMDFAAMQTKMNDYQYSCPTEFIADARLVFTNCQQYNRRSSYEAKAGLRVSAFFEKRVKELEIETSPASDSPKKDDHDKPTTKKRVRQR